MRLVSLAVIAFALFCASSCSPVSRTEDRHTDRLPFNVDLNSTARSSVLSSGNSPSIELISNDDRSLNMVVGYGNQVTGLCNAYLDTMDEFFRSFREYYQSIYQYGEDGTTAVVFAKTNLIPELSDKQRNLEEQFQAVGFLSQEQNDYVIRSLKTLRLRLNDLDTYSNTLSNYVETKEYQEDLELEKGEELLHKMNDHCAQFYQTQKELSNFIEDLQFEGRSKLLAEAVDGEASLNVLKDLRNLKGLIQRLGKWRVETDDLHDISLVYKDVVTELEEHTKYPVEKISDVKTRNDYQAVYNSIYAQMLPRINKVIFELENKNLDWQLSDFDKTMEDIFKAYNNLSRFYAEGYGKAAPLGN